MAQFDAKKLKKIGLFASGGDAPGMNAAIRSVVRTALTRGLEVYGFMGGYTGILQKNYLTMDARSVANIVQRGGSVLKAGRCVEFTKEPGRKLAADNLRALNIDALICIGGDGSLAGANALWREHKIPVVGLPGTIDNDIWGTEYTIGFDTAVNTAVDAIDKLRDTAASHDRLFIVEVMGRDSGFIAIAAGVAGGAEDIFIPENPFNVDSTVDKIKRGMARGKSSSILVTAEGHKPGRAYDLADAIQKRSGLNARVCILGHIQRGGVPTAFDRLLASRMGMAAIDLVQQGQCDVMVGISGLDLLRVEISDITKNKKQVNQQLIDLAHVLST
jgi:6-phosphofructokinase 1